MPPRRYLNHTLDVITIMEIPWILIDERLNFFSRGLKGIFLSEIKFQEIKKEHVAQSHSNF